MLSHPTIIVICGWPASGKTTLAQLLATDLNMRVIDSDQIRLLTLGPVSPDWESTEDGQRQNRREFGVVYDVIHRVVAGYAMLGRSVIITAPYTSATSWRYFQEALKDYPNVEVKVIWCSPENPSREEIEHRLRVRLAAGYQGGAADYAKVKKSIDTFTPVPLAHLKVDTFALSPQECARRAKKYLEDELSDA